MRFIGKIIRGMFWLIFDSWPIVKKYLIELLYMIVLYRVFWIVLIIGYLGIHGYCVILHEDEAIKDFICLWGYLWLKVVCCLCYIDYNKDNIKTLKKLNK